MNRNSGLGTLPNYFISATETTTQGGMAIREIDDYDSISEYTLPALAWAVNTGLVQGNAGKRIPTGSATCAQVATIFQRFYQNAAKQAGIQLRDKFDSE